MGQNIVTTKEAVEKIEAFTDDHLVDALAACGRFGLDLEDPWEGTAFECFARELTGYDPWLTGELEDDPDDWENVEIALMKRLRNAPGRLEVGADLRMHLTVEEWGRRLVGKSAEEIATALRGKP